MDTGGLTFLGRTRALEDTVYFDWTCSGFQFGVRARKVEAEIAVSMAEEDGKTLFPFLAVFLDDMEEPYKIVELREERQWVTLYEGNEEMHHIRVLKRTEAQHSKTGLKNIRIQGGSGIEPWPVEEALRLEFIGDSITCGFGNEGNCPEDGFQTCQENGWEAYAAKTARKLKAQFHMISVSGIGLYSSYTGEDKINDEVLMSDVYGYTDFYLDKSRGTAEMEAWDFGRYRPDFIVIFLGSNDISYISYDPENRIGCFRERYASFLREVREKNGKAPRILCCLGTLGEDLNGALSEAVGNYCREEKDERVRVLLLPAQAEEDGQGGGCHPSMVTHEKVAVRLTEAMKAWLKEDARRELLGKEEAEWND